MQIFTAYKVKIIRSEKEFSKTAKVLLDVIKYRHPGYDLSERHDTEEILQYIREQISFEQWFFGHWHEDFSFHQYRCLYNDVYRLC